MEISNQEHYRNIWCLDYETNLNTHISKLLFGILLTKVTPKQRKIISLLYMGMTQKDVSEYLKIDKTTLRDHLRLIKKKAEKILNKLYRG